MHSRHASSAAASCRILRNYSSAHEETGRDAGGNAGAFHQCGAYIAETIRGGILAVDEGQEEAARALGLSHWQCLRYVVLPQAVRSVLPALGNSFVSLIKDSSLASVIAAPELMYWANAANAEYYRVWETFITTGLIYLILTVTTGRLLARLERKRA